MIVVVVPAVFPEVTERLVMEGDAAVCKFCDKSVCCVSVKSGVPQVALKQSLLIDVGLLD